MMRLSIWTTAIALLAGVALAAPAIGAAPRAPRFEGPTYSETLPPSQGWALEEFVQPIAMELVDEEFQVAGRGRGKKGGGRGGARSKSRGGFSKGGERNARRGEGRRGGGGKRDGDRSVDRDRDIDADDLDDAYTSDEERVGAALVGGVVGLGVGAMINDSEDPEY